ncbi:hypothetical protein KAT36_01825 [Candidatus Pacearchaeota archaeon]|nr:hypothetical protein [Candidatus Pacearchaeota archaeon]
MVSKKRFFVLGIMFLFALSFISSSSTGLKILPPDNGIYLGSYDFDNGLDVFEQAIGKKVAIAPNVCFNAEATIPKFDINCYEKLYQKGYVSVFGFEGTPDPKNPNPNKGDFTSQQIIDGDADYIFQDMAKDIKQFGKPIFWDYPREPRVQPGFGYDGGGYGHKADETYSEVLERGGNPKAEYGNTNALDGPERYRDMCRHIHDVVEAECSGCVTWIMGAIINDVQVFGVNSKSQLPPPLNELTYIDFYPGDNYVDWHAIDIYSSSLETGVNMDFDSSAGESFQEIIAVSSNKPIMILEFGVFDSVNDRSNWFKDFFNHVKNDPKKKGYDKIGAFNYWQMGVNVFDDMIFNMYTRINSTYPSAQAWQTEIQANSNFWISNVNTGTPPTKTCSQQNGYICSASETCSGNWLTASDTSRCCDVECSSSSSITKTSGTYTCLTCAKAHHWEIDENHMLWWDNQPYIPYGGFGVQSINNQFGITDFNNWIDRENNNDPAYIQQHIKDFDKWTTEISDGGGTYIIQWSINSPPNNDASKLADPSVKQQIVDEWKLYVPAVAKEGLRGMVIWNEIDVDFSWPNTFTNDEYGNILGEYAKELKNMVGDVPISLKATGSFIYGYGKVNPVVAGATNEYAGGLGFDIFPTTCSSSNFDSVSQIKTKIEQNQKKTTWFWIAEFGVGREEGEIEGELGCYWDSFPPFQSKQDMKCYLENLVNAGAKGFIYNGPNSVQNPAGCEQSYYQSYVWYSELKNEIIQKTISTNNKETCNNNGICEAHLGETQQNCQSDCEEINEHEGETGEITSSQCYTDCMAEAGNTDAGCKSWCSGQGTEEQEGEVSNSESENGEKDKSFFGKIIDWIKRILFGESNKDVEKIEYEIQENEDQTGENEDQLNGIRESDELVSESGRVISNQCYTDCMAEAGNTADSCRAWCDREEVSEEGEEEPGKEEDITQTQCYTGCMAEVGNTDAGCRNWCNSQSDEDFAEEIG